jgi:hypothetical protein
MVRRVSAIVIVTRQNEGQVKFVPNQVADKMSDMISRTNSPSDGGISQSWSTSQLRKVFIQELNHDRIETATKNIMRKRSQHDGVAIHPSPTPRGHKALV